MIKQVKTPPSLYVSFFERSPGIPYTLFHVWNSINVWNALGHRIVEMVTKNVFMGKNL